RTARRSGNPPRPPHSPHRPLVPLRPRGSAGLRATPEPSARDTQTPAPPMRRGRPGAAVPAAVTGTRLRRGGEIGAPDAWTDSRHTFPPHRRRAARPLPGPPDRSRDAGTGGRRAVRSLMTSSPTPNRAHRAEPSGPTSGKRVGRSLHATPEPGGAERPTSGAWAAAPVGGAVAPGLPCRTRPWPQGGVCTAPVEYSAI